MKKSIFTLLSLLAFVLFLTPNLLLAQQNDQADNDKVVVITKIVDEDGNVTIERKTLNKGSNLEKNLEELNLDGLEGKDVELNVYTESNGGEVLHIEKSSGDDETVFFFRQAQEAKVNELYDEIEDLDEELKSLRITIKSDERNDEKNDERNHEKSAPIIR